MYHVKAFAFSALSLLAVSFLSASDSLGYRHNARELAVADLQQAHPESLKIMVKNFFEFLQRGAIIQAYYAFGSDELRSITTEQNFQEVMRSYPALGRNKNIVILDEQFYENLATVKLVATGQEGSRNLVEIDAIHEHGKWRVLGLQIFQVGAGL